MIDTDGCHDSPTDDYDGDSFGVLQGGLLIFRDEREVSLGTNPEFRCAVTQAANDEAGPDHWPFDFNDDRVLDFSDLAVMAPHLFEPSGAPGAARFDLFPSPSIDFSDLAVTVPYLFSSCQSSP